MVQKESNDAVFKSLTTKPKTLIPIGRVRKAHGIRGEVLLSSDSGHWPKPFPKKVFIAPFGSDVSKKTDFREVLKARPSDKGYILQLKHCENRDDAEQLQGCQLYLEFYEFKSEKGDSIFLAELLDFSVIRIKNSKVIGVVSHFLSHSYQDFIVVKNSLGASCEIPFVKSYIHDIDFKKKILYLDLPDEFPGIDN